MRTQYSTAIPAAQAETGSRRPAPGSTPSKAKPADDRRTRAEPLGHAGALTRFGAAADKSRAAAGGKVVFSFAKAAKAAIGGQAFVPHTLDLLTSDAWQARSINARRLIDLLEIEHCRHGGRENGYLRLTWDDMVRAGIPRYLIGPTIAELENLGLIVVTRGGYAGGGRNSPSLYGLTYLPQKFIGATGAPAYAPPLNYWKHYKKPAGAGSKKSV